MRLATLSEKEIIITLIALALLLLFAFCFGTLMEKIKGPRVVGEILGGMILGGSCLFLLLPSKVPCLLVCIVFSLFAFDSEIFIFFTNLFMRAY